MLTSYYLLLLKYNPYKNIALYSAISNCVNSVVVPSKNGCYKCSYLPHAEVNQWCIYCHLPLYKAIYFVFYYVQLFIIYI